MLKGATSDVAMLVVQFVVGYVAYLLSVPAILLQAFTLAFGAMAAFTLALSSGPGWMESALVSLLNAIGLNHVSYQGNPVGPILRWYFFLALAFDVTGVILKRLFPNARVKRRALFGALVAIDVVCYAFFAAIFVTSGRDVFPAVILFTVTILFTALAFAAGSAKRALVK